MFYLEKKRSKLNIVTDCEGASTAVVYFVKEKEKEEVMRLPLSETSIIDKRDLRPGDYVVELLNEELIILDSTTFKVRSKALLLIIILLLLLLLLLKCCGTATTECNTEPLGRPIADVTGDKGDGDFEFDYSGVQQELNNNTKYLNIKLSSYINVINGEGFFKIYNSNEDKSIQVSMHPYDVKSKTYDENTTVYISPLLLPNEHVEKGSLCEPLEVGEHHVIAMFHAYDENESYLGCAGQEIILNVN